MNASAVVVVVAASFSLGASAAPGIPAPKTPLAWVQASDALYADVAVGGKKLTSLLADKAELKRALQAMRVPDETMDAALKEALAEQKPSKDAKADVNVDAAVVADDDDGVHVYLFDAAGGKFAHFVWVRRGSVALLLGPPATEKRTLVDVVSSHGGAPYFVKKDGAWGAGPLPPDALCQSNLARAKDEATRVWLSERKLDEGHYTPDLKALAYQAPSGVDVKLTSATPKHFALVVTVGDTVVSAGDETFGIDIVKGNCKAAP